MDLFSKLEKFCIECNFQKRLYFNVYCFVEENVTIISIFQIRYVFSTPYFSHENEPGILQMFSTLCIILNLSKLSLQLFLVHVSVMSIDNWLIIDWKCFTFINKCQNQLYLIFSKQFDHVWFEKKSYFFCKCSFVFQSSLFTILFDFIF